MKKLSSQVDLLMFTPYRGLSIQLLALKTIDLTKKIKTRDNRK